eukprot:TRINITY_DN44258_c0_g1_i1.p1 TRINITY_DN44258_c0_g1~~TRINITY_DN44258_c0_g1_i1.p1  ORF type:complete len:418 (-),score=93.79 TRINITY_DN44258_c0_g1_i1:411-1664(-)
MAIRTFTRGTRRLLKVPFDWRDPLGLDAHLEEDEVAIRDMARSFCKTHLEPRILEGNRHEKVDVNIFREFGQAGLYAPTLSGYGCGEATSSVASGLIAKEIERIDSAYRSMWSVQSSLVMWPIHAYGTEAQKNQYLPKLASGEFIGCFGLTEPDAGSDPSAMRTTANCRASADAAGGLEWTLDGTKMWISNSPVSDVFVVWAIAGGDACPADLKGQVVGFILDKGMTGLTAPKIQGKLSLRAGPTGYICMDGVKVPDAQRLNVKGLRGPFGCLSQARFGISFGVLGAGEACFELSREYAITRRMYGGPIGSKQLVQLKLSDMATELSLGMAGCILAARNKDAGRLTFEAISILKRNSTTKARTVAAMARDLHGGNGVCDEYHVMRHMNNIESVHTYEGTADIHALIVGRGITGLAAF